MCIYIFSSAHGAPLYPPPPTTTSQELFHRSIFAFKHVALQILGNFFKYILVTGSTDGCLAVLDVTSGDTRSDTIYGLRGKKGWTLILYLKGCVSEIPKRQMTTVPDNNIYSLKVDGTFDDYQDIAKVSFVDAGFQDRVCLGAVNSITW